MRSLICLAALFSLVRGQHGSRPLSARHRSSESFPTIQNAVEAVPTPGTCNVTLPQSQVDAWQSWMQEGFNSCSDAAARQLNASDTSSDQPLLVLCYRVGFVARQRFGGELLVMQVGSLSNSSNSTSRRMIRRRSTNKLQVQLTYDKQTLSAPVTLLDMLDSESVSTNITSPAYSTTLGGQPSQLIATFHFDRAYSSSVDASASNASNLAPLDVNLIGQAAQILNLGSMLVNLAGVSTQEQNFNATGPWGLFTASSASSSHLTDDNQCQVTVSDDDSASTSAPNVVSTSSSTATAVSTPSTTDSSTSLGAPTSISVASGNAVADNADPSTASVPGQKLAVLPIGLGIFGGVAGISVIITLFVTFERRKHRRQYRERRLQEQLAAIGEFRGPTDHIGMPRPMSQLQF